MGLLTGSDDDTAYLIENGILDQMHKIYQKYKDNFKIKALIVWGCSNIAAIEKQ